MQIMNTQRVGVTAWRGTVTKDNHLYGVFRSKPQMASEIMTVLMSSMHLPTLDTYLSSIPVKEYDDDSELFWDVIGSSRRNIPLVEARRMDGTVVTKNSANVGVNYEPFYLVFATDWFADGEVIWGNMNEAYPIIVKEQPRNEGTNVVLLCEPFGAHLAGGIPSKRLLAGERFSVGYAPVERNLSRQVGDVRFTSPVSMSSEWQSVRIHTRVGGKDLGKLLCCKIPVSKEVNGKIVTATVDRWIHNVTWELEKQWSEYKNNSLERGVSTRFENGEYSNFGKSGLPNQQGMGFRQLMNLGNVMYYPKFSLALIEDALMGISAGKIDYKKRKFVIRTGEYGARLISREAKKDASGWHPIFSGNDPSYFSKGPETNFTNGNAITITDYQVTRWISSNGLDVSILVDSSKDDLQTNKIMHPLGGPAESYRFDIFYNDDEQEPNFQKCVIKGQPELRGYQWGPFHNPFTGEFNNSSASYDEDAADVHYKATQGILLKDPTRVISLIPDLLED